MVPKGIVGAIIFAVGGAILFYLLYIISWEANHDYLYLPTLLLIVFSFIGFLIVGIGFWQILTSSKSVPEKSK
jgi:hypothetical protein